MFPILLGVIAGAVTPAQTAINTRLRHAVGSPLRASMISFSMGLLTMLIATLVAGPYPLIPQGATSGPWWMWLPGLCGGIFLTGNILLLPHLGSLQTVMMPVMGQIAMGLLIDQFGWFGAEQRSLNTLRTIGALVATIGFLVTVVLPSWLAHRNHDDIHDMKPSMASAPATSKHHTVWLWRLAGIGFGACAAIQIAMLGTLGTALGSPLKAAVVSFALALLLLAAVVGVREHSYNISGAWHGQHPWWMWCGGFIGAGIVLSNAFLSPRLGTGVTVLLVLLGQVLGGVLIDQCGLLGVPRRRISTVQIIGLILAIGGIALIRLS